MKRLLTVLVLLMLVSLSYGVKVKYSSLSWVDYAASFDNTFAMDDTTGGFAIDRLYNTFKVKLSDDVKVRVTVDLKKVATPWKYVYADWKIATPLVVTFGLQKAWFGYTPLWKYPLPVKALADRVKASASADFGIGVGGKFADGLVSYNLQLLNGEGYSNPLVLDASYAWEANVVITPVKEMLSIGLSFRMAEKTKLIPVPKFADNAFAAYVDFKQGDIWALAQFVGLLPQGSDMQSSEQLTAGYKLSEGVSVYADFLNKYASATNSTQEITLGANLSPAKGLTLIPYAQFVLDAGLNQILLGMRTQIKFGFTIAE